jgi:hypothetical protein
MGNFLYGLLSGYNSMGRYSKVMILLLSMLGIFSSFSSVYSAAPATCGSVISPVCGTAGGDCSASTAKTAGGDICSISSSYGCSGGAYQCVNQTEAVIFPLCGVYNTVHNVIFLLGIVLVILGGALYAGAHVMPSQSKGTIQGYGMGFILGGIIGVIIAILAPFIIGLVSGRSGNSILTVCNK